MLKSPGSPLASEQSWPRQSRASRPAAAARPAPLLASSAGGTRGAARPAPAGGHSHRPLHPAPLRLLRLAAAAAAPLRPPAAVLQRQEHRALHRLPTRPDPIAAPLRASPRCAAAAAAGRAYSPRAGRPRLPRPPRPSLPGGGALCRRWVREAALVFLVKARRGELCSPPSVTSLFPLCFVCPGLSFFCCLFPLSPSLSVPRPFSLFFLLFFPPCPS